MSKKKAPKGAFYGSADSFFSQKKKVVLGNVKYSGDKKDISLSKSGLGDSVFSDVDSLSSDKEGVSMTGINVGSLLGSAVNTLKAKHVNTGAVFGSSLGSPNFNMDDNEEVFLFFRLSISLEKRWIDSKIVKTQVEVSVRKLFALDINFLAVKRKLVMAKTQLIRKIFSTINEKSMEMAISLAREKRINVNSNLKRQGMKLDWAVVIKKISMNTLKDMIIAASFLIGKNFVRIAKAVKDHKIWTSRDWFRALLFTLLVGMTAHDFGTLLERAGEKTCIINRSLETGNRIYCIVVSFAFDNNLESARIDMVWCEKCGKFGYFALECDTTTVSSSKLSRIFKRVASDEYSEYVFSIKYCFYAIKESLSFYDIKVM
ncbi:hypothetical protein G9A89_010670 [Geosiphon pyriformis]|nr:hypothetical protein G9A89_010670 [Geosiphon pyriformis]